TLLFSKKSCGATVSWRSRDASALPETPVENQMNGDVVEHRPVPVRNGLRPEMGVEDDGWYETFFQNFQTEPGPALRGRSAPDAMGDGPAKLLPVMSQTHDKYPFRGKAIPLSRSQVPMGASSGANRPGACRRPPGHGRRAAAFNRGSGKNACRP